MIDLEVASCGSTPFMSRKCNQMDSKTKIHIMETDDYPTNKKFSVKFSEGVKSLNFSQKINSSFDSEFSGNDVERGLSSSFGLEMQRGLKIHQPDNCVENVYNFIRTNWPKIFTVIFLFVGQIVVKFGGLIQDKDVDKPSDKLQDATQALNQFLLNSGFAQIWIITCSLSLDIQFFLVLFFWLFKGYSFRIVIALLMFYIIRAILQALFILPFPDDYYWENPGFPCLMNMYGKQSDFFYSGHVGFSALCTIENFRCGVKWAGYYGIAATIFQGLTLLIFQVHYTIDIFTGLVMCHYCFYLAGFVSNWVDKKILRQEVLDLNPNNKPTYTTQVRPLLNEEVSNHLSRKRVKISNV